MNLAQTVINRYCETVGSAVTTVASFTVEIQTKNNNNVKQYGQSSKSGKVKVVLFWLMLTKLSRKYWGNKQKWAAENGFFNTQNLIQKVNFRDKILDGQMVGSKVKGSQGHSFIVYQPGLV